VSRTIQQERQYTQIKIKVNKIKGRKVSVEDARVREKRGEIIRSRGGPEAATNFFREHFLAPSAGYYKGKTEQRLLHESEL
jgi:hypothetical protein